MPGERLSSQCSMEESGVGPCCAWHEAQLPIRREERWGLAVPSVSPSSPCDVEERGWGLATPSMRLSCLRSMEEKRWGLAVPSARHSWPMWSWRGLASRRQGGVGGGCPGVKPPLNSFLGLEPPAPQIWRTCLRALLHAGVLCISFMVFPSCFIQLWFVLPYLCYSVLEYDFVECCSCFW